jgi:hypothetical protein
MKAVRKSNHFGVWAGMQIVMFRLVSPFWPMCGTAVACMNFISPYVLGYDDS